MTDNQYLTYSRMPDPYLGEGVGVRTTLDPVGKFNSVIQLYRREGRQSILFGKAAIYPIRVGAVVSLTRRNEPTIRLWGPTWQEITGGRSDDVRQPGCDDWIVTVDEKEVLRVPFVESLPPQPPTPTIPWGTRVQARIMHWRNGVRRSTVDVLATRLGYTRTGECDCDDDYY